MQQNPFPGMNPWLESHWGDIHTRLTTYASDQIQPQLPAGLRARVEEYVGVDVDDENENGGRFASPSQSDSNIRFSPAVRVIEHLRPEVDRGGTAVAIAVAEPVLVTRRLDPPTLRRIQIVDSANGHRIVTAIEFLSPANKIGRLGRRKYLKKQALMLEANVNLVEIDLIRLGSWVLAAPESAVPEYCRHPYRISVVRAEDPDVAEVYPARMDQPLPTIRIPLRPDDKDVTLQLQSLLNMAYVNGRYGDDIDYREPPKPPLVGSDAEWADVWLREQKIRV